MDATYREVGLECGFSGLNSEPREACLPEMWHAVCPWAHFLNPENPLDGTVSR